MNLAYLETLLDYHYWARDRMLTAVEQLTPDEYERDLRNSFPAVRDTVNHLFLAEWIWFSRWQGQSPGGFPSKEELPDFATVRRRWLDQEPRVRAFVSGLDDIQRPYSYTLLNGTAATSKFWEMLVHVVNHATYHRGQVTTMLRQLGAKPPASMDMITYFRESAAKAVV
ncbi:MAG TPA: DinB family protein [Gemmatimonadaceae bacterium]|nr:DinB family protein [Gemmatimonadaceae bacterium]